MYDIIIYIMYKISSTAFALFWFWRSTKRDILRIVRLCHIGHGLSKFLLYTEPQKKRYIVYI